MKGVFRVIVDGRLQTYLDVKDIPDQFDNLIEFRPTVIPGPHTKEEHEAMDSWNRVLKDLMKREKK